ncbi:MAG: zinc-ribbon domain-containing protein [Deltaproteobacteria bacterium]|nr:zinc-ribbon domain-containing protein [Deltaproteobacteria bacterium]
MIVTCEECQTRFNVDESLIDAEGSKAQCSVCGAIFTIRQEPVEDNFDDIEADLLLSYEEFTDDKKDKKIGYGTIAVILILALLGAAVVLELSGVNIPFLKGVSFSGKAVDKEENISNKRQKAKVDNESYVSILDMKADIVDNEKLGKLFVITGKAKNNSTDSITSILVTANLYAADNTILKTKDVFCGNMISQKGLQTYGVSQINEALNNPQNKTEIKPDELIEFMAVFFDFPENPDKFDIVVKKMRQAAQATN